MLLREKLQFLVLILTVLGASACAKPEDGRCEHIAEDQQGTLMVPMAQDTTTLITVDPSFTKQERDSINHAVSVWNAFSGRQIKYNFFEVRVADVGSSLPTKSNDCNFSGDGSDAFRIVRETSTERWSNLKLDSTNPGVTIRCKSGDELSRQVILMNPAYTEPSQFMSVVLHELGHSIGLDHSCMNGAGQSDFASCDGLAQGHGYRQAVMFPVIRLPGALMGLPERKEELRANDMDRARCLY